MKKMKRIGIAIIIFILILGVFTVTQAATVTLEQIVQKFNNCSTVKQYESLRFKMGCILYRK